MRRLTLLTLFALTACTPSQREAWIVWFEVHPRAATRFALDGCGGLGCDVDSSQTAVESEPNTSGWSDVTTGGDIFDQPGWGQCAQWMDDALAAGWTEEQWATLNWIMAAESNCDPGATSPAGARGLLQVMPFWADECGGGDLYEPWFNLSCGLHVYHQQGFSAWDVY